MGIAVDITGKVYVSDLVNHRVQKFTSKGKFIDGWKIHDSGGVGNLSPHNIAISQSGFIYITDPTNQCVRIYYSPSIQSVTSYEKKSVTWEGIKQAKLYQNYPNPSNPETWIPFTVAKASSVSIIIYNVNGYLTKRINLGHREPGIYLSKNEVAYWDGKNQYDEPVTSGVYFYQLMTDNYISDTRKMLIIK